MSVTDYPTTYPPTATASPETSGMAVAALTLAVVLASVPILGQIVALVVAWRARAEVRRNEGDLRGGQLARAAEIVSSTLLVGYLITAAVGIGLLMRLSGS